MGRYLLKFSKEGNLKYISHLDLLRVFQRAFKRAGIRLRYSQGFNPHAKMGFAHPLSLGYESAGEYLEFETTDDGPGEARLLALEPCMPRGIRLSFCKPLPETSKTSLAAAVRYASYVVRFQGDGEQRAALSQRLPEYIRRDEILNKKLNKKKKIVETNIRPLILSFSAVESKSEEAVFSMTLKTGSDGNLNPEVLIRSFCEFCGVEYLRHRWSYRRTEMYIASGAERGIRPLSEFGG